MLLSPQSAALPPASWREASTLEVSDLVGKAPILKHTFEDDPSEAQLETESQVHWNTRDHRSLGQSW